MLHSPLFEEQLRSHLQSRPILRLLRSYLVVLSLMLIISWPNNPLSHYLQFSGRPATFQFVFLILFLFAFILSILPRSIQDQGAYSLIEWISYTPVGVCAAYIGRFAFSTCYVLFLIALPSPLIIIAATATGVPPRRVAAACVVLLVFCLNFRTFLLMLQLILMRRPIIRVLTAGLILLFLLFLSVRLAPIIHPVLVIQGILSGTDQISLLNYEREFTWTATVLIYGLSLGICIVISITAMKIFKSRLGKPE